MKPPKVQRGVLFREKKKKTVEELEREGEKRRYNTVDG